MRKLLGVCFLLFVALVFCKENIDEESAPESIADGPVINLNFQLLYSLYRSLNLDVLSNLLSIDPQFIS